MNNLYDNGALLMGNINKVIDYVKMNIKENISMLFIDSEELLKELIDLRKELGKDLIVYVNYETYRNNYELNYFINEDIVK